MRVLEYVSFLNVILIYTVRCGDNITSSEEFINAVEMELKNANATSATHRRSVFKLLALVRKQREELIRRDKRIYATVCSGEFRSHVFAMEKKFMSTHYIEKDARYEDILFKSIDSEWRAEIQGNQTLYEQLNGDQLRKAYSKFICQQRNYWFSHRKSKWRLFLRWLAETRGTTADDDGGNLEAFYESFKEANDQGMTYSSFIENILTHWNHAFKSTEIPADVNVVKLYEDFMKITSVKNETAKFCASLLGRIFKFKTSNAIFQEKEKPSETLTQDEQPTPNS